MGPADRQGVKRAAFELRESLLAHTGVRWVQGVVVLWSAFPGAEANREGVVYLHGDRLAAWLRAQREELTPEQVERVGDYLQTLEPTGFEPQRQPRRRAA